MMEFTATMSKSTDRCDALVLGGHPAAYLAAALLRAKPALNVLHAPIKGEAHPDRLLVINPSFFALHKLLSPLSRKLSAFPVYGLCFLSDKPETSSEYHSRSITGYIAHYSQVRDAIREITQHEGVQLLDDDQVEIGTPHPDGVEVTWKNGSCCAKTLIVAGALPAAQHRMLGLPVSWGPGVLHRLSFAALPRDVQSPPSQSANKHPVIPMSLDLDGSQAWAWMLADNDRIQLLISQSVDSIRSHPPEKLMQKWATLLQTHGILAPRSVDHASMKIDFMELPLAGALVHEGVADRTVLVGPAGGFYSACAEDIYPNCWSAVYACQVLRKALKEPHLQDALAAYRSAWRTTLGDYLRGPQQNLRFLLPLVYRNQVMTNRLGEAIMLGKSVVR